MLAIIALVAGMTISAGTTQLDIAKLQGTKQSLEVVRQALNLFQKKYGRYPCPADPVLATSHANYGVEYSSGSCAGACPMGGLSCGTNAVIGMVPFKTIGLNEGVSYDAWDRRITYAVDKNHTATSDYANGSLSVQDGSGNEITNSDVLGKAIFVLGSHGEDGNGGYTKMAQLAKACGATAKDIENCDNNDDIFVSPPFNNGDVAASYSDDLIAWQTQEHVNEEAAEETTVSLNATISAGSAHVCAIKDDGTVWCWGNNDHSELGDNTTTDRHTPVQAIGVTDAIDIAARDMQTFALKSDGALWWWPRVGWPEPPAVNVNISGLEQIGAWSDYACGLKSDGTLWCQDMWNDPIWYDKNISGAVQVGIGYGTFKCALKSDGTVWCLGEGDAGELGDGTCNDSATPVQVSGLTDAVSINPATPRCAVKSDGTLWCWGEELMGAGACSAAQVPGLSDVTMVRVGGGGLYTCALKSDGTLWCFGNNSYGQFGDGNTNMWWTGTPVQASIAGVVEITAGGLGVWGFTCARKADDSIWCWGVNSSGNLGDNTVIERHSPVQVQNFP